MRKTVDEFDQNGKLIRRTVTEEDTQRLSPVVVPQPYPWIMPYPPPIPTITWDNSQIFTTLTASLMTVN